MPQHDRERQRRQRRQRADDEGGADALERLVEHVVAGQVGAEHVVVAHQQRPRRRPAGTHDQQRPAHDAPRDRRLAAPDAQRACARRQRWPRAPRQRQRAQPTAAPPRPQPEQQAQRDRARRRRPPTASAGSVRCAPPNISRGATRCTLAVDLDRLLGEADVGQRARVGGLARLDQVAPAARRAAIACACRRPRRAAALPGGRRQQRRGSARCRAASAAGTAAGPPTTTAPAASREHLAPGGGADSGWRSTQHSA